MHFRGGKVLARVHSHDDSQNPPDGGYAPAGLGEYDSETLDVFPNLYIWMRGTPYLYFAASLKNYIDK